MTGTTSKLIDGFTDFLGKAVVVGDHVVYAAQSGRSSNMIYGRVTEIYRVYYSHTTWAWERVPDSGVPAEELDKLGRTDGPHQRVKIMPVQGARWSQHHGRDFWVDTRTGKRINPDAPSGRHILKESHYVYADGTEVDLAAERENIKRANAMANWHQTTYPDDEYGLDRWLCDKFNVHIGGTVGEVRAYKFGNNDKLHLTPIWWQSRTYQPWVEKGNEQKSVTILNIENIVRVDAPEDLA